MGLEIEHKYLVNDGSYRQMASRVHHILQGYLSRESRRTVRVRLRDDSGFITIKGKSHGASRPEFEYEIPADDARQLLALCPPPVLDKDRYIIEFEGHTWEVDEFHGTLEGLVTAEIELPSEDSSYTTPPFIGKDVTGDHRYSNSHLGISDKHKASHE
ncbi:MAG: CYTH domain-containing protein [Bacteroidales bacterium]|nr:CYTH domain-containing protein [Candidatus Sodaliphilus aphodohippi]